MGLARYILIRALLVIPTILILYTMVFIILRMLPGNPVLAAIGTKNIPEEQLQTLMRELGLDKPLYIQYFEYLFNVLHGDFGTSLVIRGRGIAQDLAERLPATIELAIASIAVSLFIGIATGYIAASRRDTFIDSFIRIFGAFTYVIFIPWLGLLLQLVFGVWLGLLPIGGRYDPSIYYRPVTGFIFIDSLATGNIGLLFSAASHMILPAITLGIVLSGPYTRLVRANMVKQLESNYVFAYRARGVSEGRVRIYAFRNALIPVVTYAGLQFALLLGGAVLTETTYSWPGIGTYLVERVYYRDYPAIQATVITFAFFVGVISLIVDVIYALIDPRIRY